MTKTKKILLRWANNFFFPSFIITALCCNNAYSQLTFDNSLTAKQMAQLLAGPGITVTNATMNCPANAGGSFSGSSNIGMPGGIILTSGSTSYAAGPNNSGSAGTNNSAPGEPQLTGLAGSTTYDACALEFDIYPLCSTLVFNYVFGSEEYPEWVNSSYNDAFAFFISGPGIPGQQNIAIVPSTALPVTIDNINANNNSQYYVNNAGGATIQYDGFTTVLTATIILQACQTYHLKLVIADAGDGVYDSGVFLEEGSMLCNAVTATATIQNAIEGCQDGQFAFCRSVPTGSPLTINYTLSGTAINGTDYSSISNSITIPAGQSCITLSIIPNSDGIPEGTETVMIIYQQGPCPGNDTAIVNITDGPFVTITPSSPSICPGDNVVLIASGAVSYTWSPATGLNTTTGSSVIASPPVTTTYTVTGSDGTCTSIATVTVTVDPCIILSTAQTNVTCYGGCDGTATVTASGGIIPYIYSWTPAGGTGTTASNLCAGTYTVTVTDNSGYSTSASVTITEPPPLSVPVTAIDISCTGLCDGITTAIPSNGLAPYTYLWSPSGGTGATATGHCAGTYTVNITDTNGCTGSNSATISAPPLPLHLL
ncbi:MAG: choice-of-anchor L domain-containing protein [Bacteroidota bacterium]